MKKTNNELRPEYSPEELGHGVRGKHFQSYNRGTNLVLLRPEVAKAFPSEEAVNEALSALIDIARKSARGKNRRAPRANQQA